jgi:hypothetical protein
MIHSQKIIWKKDRLDKHRRIEISGIRKSLDQMIFLGFPVTCEKSGVAAVMVNRWLSNVTE